MAHFYIVVNKNDRDEVVARFDCEDWRDAVQRDEERLAVSRAGYWWEARSRAASREDALKAMRRRAPGLRGHWHPVPGVPGCEVWAKCSPEEAASERA